MSEHVESYCNCRKGGGGLHDPGPGCFAWDLGERAATNRIVAIIEEEVEQWHGIIGAAKLLPGHGGDLSVADIHITALTDLLTTLAAESEQGKGGAA